MLAGGTATRLFDFKLTAIPPTGAKPVNFTVPVADPPPTTEVGLTMRPDKDGGLTVRFTTWEFCPCTPVIVAVNCDETGFVPTEKFADEAPTGTVTEAGIVMFGLLDDKLTVTDFPATTPVSWIVPVAPVPPVTDVGATDIPLRFAAAIVTVICAVKLAPP
jgi:hypothetical protein